MPATLNLSKTYGTSDKAAKAATTAGYSDEQFETVKDGRRWKIVLVGEQPLLNEPSTDDTTEDERIEDAQEEQVGDVILKDGRVLRELSSDTFWFVGTPMNQTLTVAQVNAILAAEDEDEETDETMEVPNTLDANRAESSVEKPVRYVHRRVNEILDANPSTRRKDLVATLEAEGVAYYTARTQVQEALKRRRAAGQGAPVPTPEPTPEPVRIETDEATGEQVVVIDGSELIVEPAAETPTE